MRVPAFSERSRQGPPPKLVAAILKEIKDGLVESGELTAAEAYAAGPNPSQDNWEEWSEGRQKYVRNRLLVRFRWQVECPCCTDVKFETIQNRLCPENE